MPTTPIIPEKSAHNKTRRLEAIPNLSYDNLNYDIISQQYNSVIGEDVKSSQKAYIQNLFRYLPEDIQTTNETENKEKVPTDALVDTTNGTKDNISADLTTNTTNVTTTNTTITNHDTAIEDKKLHFSIQEILLFASVISATDAVAALTFISEATEPKLYSILFGEGVINDAVCIVLYGIIQELSHSKESKYNILRLFILFIIFN